VRKNALEFNAGFRLEMLRVIFHGALHLCGYSDKSTVTTRKMRAKEDFYLDRFNP
jgi:rRNA maturation RNase YbeY